MRNIFALLKYALPYKTFLILAVISMFVQVCVGFYIPFIMIDIIDVALPAQDFNEVLMQSLIMVGLALIGLVAGILNTYTSQYISQYATAELRLDLFRKIQTLSFKNIDDFKQSRLITNATNDVMRVQMFFTMMLRIVLRAPLMIIVGLILALRTSLLLSQVFYVTIPLLVISVAVIMFLAYPRFKKVQIALDDVNNVVLENANAPQVIKSFVSQPYEQEKFEAMNEKYREVNTSAESVMALTDPLIQMIFNLGVAMILFVGAYYLNIGEEALFVGGEPRVGLLMAFNQYSQQILIGLMMFAMIMIFLSRADVSAQRINEIFDADIDLLNPEDGVKPTIKGDIVFDNVSFGFGENGNYVLKNLSFHIKPGEKVGVIGSTGSGKSALTYLIPRLYDVKEGKVLIDQENVQRYDIPYLREHIGYVTQNASIFSGSIATNMLQGKEDADLKALTKASKDALLYDFIEEQEESFNYLTKSKGVNLSGGQKQRLSIARALIRKPKILVLDDATSAVDLASESKILNHINAVDYAPTLLLISQKIATVRRMDKILVLNNEGELDGFGKHESLIKTSNTYKEIAASQLNLGGEDLD